MTRKQQRIPGTDGDVHKDITAAAEPEPRGRKTAGRPPE